MPPAARVGDFHVCPFVDPGPKPHVGGPIMPPGCPTVTIGGAYAARVGDKAACTGPPDVIAKGSPTVLIGNKFAARMGDNTVHGGVIVAGCPTVWIGEMGMGRASTHFTQEQDYSCVIASSRNMIAMLTGQDIPESQLRDEMREIMKKPDHDFNKNGINPAYAIALLKKHGVDAEAKSGVSAADLPDHLKSGKPVLIGFPGHRVMLDGVSTDGDGNKTYHVRDPDPAYNGQTRDMSEADFGNVYNPNAIVIVPK